MNRGINKNDLIIVILTFFIFLPNLLFVILGENTAINSIIKKFAYISFAFSIIVIPLIFLKPKFFFSLIFPLLPFMFFDVYLIYITKNHSTSIYYTSIFNTNLFESLEWLESNKILLSIGVVSIIVYCFLLFKLDLSYKISLTNKLGIGIVSTIVIGIIFFKVFTIQMNNRTNNISKGILTTFDRNYIQYSFPFGVINKLVKVIVSEKSLKEFKSKNKNFTYKPEVYSNINQTVVLVLGETARKHNFQLYGYSRETTPILSKEKNLIVYKEATTNSNFTWSSFPLILSSVNPIKFEDRLSELGLVYAFKEAGFHTYWLTNQPYNHGHIYKLYSSAAEYFKDVTHDFRKDYYDENLLKYFKEALQDKNKKRLIVLHTMGSHSRYNKRYPKKFSKFSPDHEGAITWSSNTIKKIGREIFVNSYDNSIFYTDYFLGSLIKYLKDYSPNSLLLYVSDHGENLYDDEREMVGHGGSNPTKYELEIPLIIWYSEGYNNEVINKLNSNSDKKISSSTVFHTLSSIGGFKTKLHQYKFDLLSDSLQVGNRSFYIEDEKALNIDN